METSMQIDDQDQWSALKYNWASEASPTLGCSIEISRDIYICIYIYIYVYIYICIYVGMSRMSN